MFGRPAPKPLKPRQTIEVSGEHIKLRIVLWVLLVAIAVTAAVLGMRAIFTRDPGWITVRAESEIPAQATAELSFQYCLGENATAEIKQLTALYTQLAGRAYRVYHPTERFEGLGNLAALNAAPNQDVTLEPELYRALELVTQLDSRVIFLGPAYAQYDAVFRSREDAEAALYDPMRNPEAGEYLSQLMAFAGDPEAISLSLLGENRARLRVSEAYLDFAAAYEIQALLDFYWTRNAFVLDDLAAGLSAQGYSRGYLVSAEGFGRYLGPSQDSYTVELRDLRSDQLGQPARLELEGPLSAAALHGYSLSGSAGDYFYRYEDGSLRMPYLDSRSGQCRCAIPDLTLLSDGVGCGELALRANELLTASAWEREKAAALGAAGIGALWCENKTLYHTALPCGLELTDPSYAERQLP